MATYRKWINSFPAVNKWAKKYDLEKSLDEGGGIAFFKDFLPTEVAEGVLNELERIRDWNATAADRDYAHNNIRHAFWSTRQAPALDTITRAITQIMPDSLHSFSAAKYMQGHHIVRHDDRAYTDVLMEDGAIVQCSRNIALIVYFTKDWKEEYGGLLIDHEAPGGQHTFVPQFNMAVAFRIPRWHTVTPMAVDRPRYTLFGWFLEPGQLYDLELEDAGEAEDDEEGLIGLSQLQAQGLAVAPPGSGHVAGAGAQGDGAAQGEGAEGQEGARQARGRNQREAGTASGHGRQGKRALRHGHGLWEHRLRGTRVSAPQAGSGKRRVLQMLAFKKVMKRQSQRHATAGV